MRLVRINMFNSFLHIFAPSQGHIDEAKPLLPLKENKAKIFILCILKCMIENWKLSNQLEAKEL